MTLPTREAGTTGVPSAPPNRRRHPIRSLILGGALAAGVAGIAVGLLPRDGEAPLTSSTQTPTPAPAESEPGGEAPSSTPPPASPTSPPTSAAPPTATAPGPDAVRNAVVAAHSAAYRAFVLASGPNDPDVARTHTPDYLHHLRPVLAERQAEGVVHRGAENSELRKAEVDLISDNEALVDACWVARDEQFKAATGAQLSNFGPVVEAHQDVLVRGPDGQWRVDDGGQLDPDDEFWPCGGIRP
ncbi:MAG: hypothetical protein ACRD0F_04640 [Acidimicrobiales bacterium]